MYACRETAALSHCHCASSSVCAPSAEALFIAGGTCKSLEDRKTTNNQIAAVLGHSFSPNKSFCKYKWHSVDFVKISSPKIVIAVRCFNFCASRRRTKKKKHPHQLSPIASSALFDAEWTVKKMNTNAFRCSRCRVRNMDRCVFTHCSIRITARRRAKNKMTNKNSTVHEQVPFISFSKKRQRPSNVKITNNEETDWKGGGGESVQSKHD